MLKPIKKEDCPGCSGTMVNHSKFCVAYPKTIEHGNAFVPSRIFPVPAGRSDKAARVYIKFCHELNKRQEEVWQLAKQLHNTVYRTDYDEQSQFTKDLWNEIARAVLYSYAETLPPYHDDEDFVCNICGVGFQIGNVCDHCNCIWGSRNPKTES